MMQKTWETLGVKWAKSLVLEVGRKWLVTCQNWDFLRKHIYLNKNALLLKCFTWFRLVRTCDATVKFSLLWKRTQCLTDIKGNLLMERPMCLISNMYLLYDSQVFLLNGIIFVLQTTRLISQCLMGKDRVELLKLKYEFQTSLDTCLGGGRVPDVKVTCVVFLPYHKWYVYKTASNHQSAQQCQ